MAGKSPEAGPAPELLRRSSACAPLSAGPRSISRAGVPPRRSSRRPSRSRPAASRGAAGAIAAEGRAERARPGSQGRRDPRQRRRPTQVAADPQGQRRARWCPRADRGQADQDDRQGSRGEGRQDAHRARQGGQGQGRPDRGRQGPGSAQQDGSSRGRCERRPRPRRASPRTKATAEAETKTAAGQAGPRSGQERDDQECIDQDRGQARSGEGGQGTCRPRPPQSRRPRPRPRLRRSSPGASARRRYWSVRRSTTGPAPRPGDRAAG